MVIISYMYALLPESSGELGKQTGKPATFCTGYKFSETEQPENK
jgi:hypothetical protein